MIDLRTFDGTRISINPIHIIGLMVRGSYCTVLTDHPGEYSTIDVVDDYDRLRSLLEDELYGFERRS